MSVQRRDLIQIAQTVKNNKHSFRTLEDYIDFVNDLCVIFEQMNDRFDSDKFKLATDVI